MAAAPGSDDQFGGFSQSAGHKGQHQEQGQEQGNGSFHGWVPFLLLFFYRTTGKPGDEKILGKQDKQRDGHQGQHPAGGDVPPLGQLLLAV